MVNGWLQKRFMEQLHKVLTCLCVISGCYSTYNTFQVALSGSLLEVEYRCCVDICVAASHTSVCRLFVFDSFSVMYELGRPLTAVRCACLHRSFRLSCRSGFPVVVVTVWCDFRCAGPAFEHQEAFVRSKHPGHWHNLCAIPGCPRHALANRSVDDVLAATGHWFATRWGFRMSCHLLR